MQGRERLGMTLAAPSISTSCPNRGVRQRSHSVQPIHRFLPTTRATAIGLTLVLALGAIATVQGQTSKSAPAPTGPPTPLSAYVPGEGILFYAEFAGLDAHADAWKRSSAYKILNETPTGAMLEEVVAQLLTQTTLKTMKAKITGAEAVTLIKHVARQGMVVSAFGKENSAQEQPGVIVLRGVFKNKETRPIIARLIVSDVDPKVKPKIVDVAGHKIVVQKGTKGGFEGWWVDEARKEDLILIPPVSSEALVVKTAGTILATLEDRSRSAINYPARTALAKEEDSFVPVGFAFLDIAAIMPPNTPPELGLQAVKSLDYRWGFQEKETVSVLRVTAPKPRQGLLALVDQPTFDKAGLPPIPDGVTAFSVFSFAPKSLYDQVTTLAKTFNPQAGTQIDAISDQVKAKTRLRLKEDILGHLGPKLAIYVAPAPKATAATAATTETKAPAPAMNPLTALLGGAEIPRLTLIADIDDPVAFGRVLDELMIQVNQGLRSAMPALPGAGGGAGAPSSKGARGPNSGIEFKLVPGPNKVYMIVFPSSLVGMIPSYIRPTIRVSAKHVVFSIAPDAARQALEVKGGGAAVTTYAATLQPAPPNLLFVNVTDPTETLPSALAGFPGALQTKVNEARHAAAAAAPAPVAPEGADPNAADADVVLTVEAAKLPTAAAIKPFLFASSSSVSVDPAGIKLISREAFPNLGSLVANSPMNAVLNTLKSKMPPGVPGMGAGMPAPGGAPAGASTPPNTGAPAGYPGAR